MVIECYNVIPSNLFKYLINQLCKMRSEITLINFSYKATIYLGISRAIAKRNIHVSYTATFATDECFDQSVHQDENVDNIKTV